ncbi:MAG: hypothetical protein ACRCZ9_06215 [Fusobacteriaceae bacterium]
MSEKYIFECFVSKKNYTEKPNSKNLKSEQTILKQYLEKTNKKPNLYSLEQIAKHISIGKTITSTITDTTRMLVIDIDNGINEKDLVNFLKVNDIIPNIYYRTFSWNPSVGKYKMRLIYKLKETLSKQEYDDFYEVLIAFFPVFVNEDGITKSVLDTALRNFNQLVHGTNQQTKLIHHNEFSTEVFIKKSGYTAPVKQEKTKQVYVKSDVKGVNDILAMMHEDIETADNPFQKSYYLYHTLKEFGLEDSLKIKEEWKTKHENSKIPELDTNNFHYKLLKNLKK